MKDYYKILEVEENASEDEIKKNYRILSKKYHPDINPNGDEKFKEVVEAYDVLSDKNKRSQYDNSRNNPMGGHNIQDIFANMFGNADFFNHRKSKTAPDKIVKVQITPVESYKGEVKTIQYVKENHCNHCDGKGGDLQKCNSCGGNGFHMKTFGTGFMVQHIRTSCGECGGRGYKLIHKCFYCDGKGTKSEVNSVTFSLPNGIDSGEYIKLPNAGDFKNGQYGDLIIQIEVVPRDNYEKINNDLIYNLFLNYNELLRDEYSVPHPDGEILVSAPKIFDSSKPLRIRNRGFRGGDMYVKLNVKFER